MSDQKKVCFRIEAYHVKVNRSHVPVKEKAITVKKETGEKKKRP
jgi:hypothetical protein